MFQSKRKTPCWKPGLPFPTPPPPSSLKDSLKECAGPGYTQIGVGRETEALVLKPRPLPFCDSGGFPRGAGGSGDPGEIPLFLRGQFWDREEEYRSTKQVLSTELVVPPEAARAIPVCHPYRLAQGPHPPLGIRICARASPQGRGRKGVAA